MCTGHDPLSFANKLTTVVASLQEIRSIATIIIATASFRCNRMQYCHETPIRGNSLHVLPQFSFVAVVTFFVAKEGVYCNKT
jgi:hypothetical protein